jgi:hypothetical protein
LLACELLGKLSNDLVSVNVMLTLTIQTYTEKNRNPNQRKDSIHKDQYPVWYRYSFVILGLLMLLVRGAEG